MMAKLTQTLVGVDLGGTNVRAALVKDGRLGKVQSLKIRAFGTKQEVLSDLFSVIDPVIDRSVAGIGLGVPSLVDKSRGLIFDTTNIPSWTKVPLKQILEKKYGVPVRIDNDANCFALAEHRYGAGKGVQNFVGLIVGTGLGAGIISNGRLHSGLHCGAGEFGQIPYGDSILEHYAAGQFFKRHNTTGLEAAKAAETGDPNAQRVFEEFGKHFAFALKTIMYALAPEMIVLGGSVGRSYKYYKASLEEHMKDFVYPFVWKDCKIRISKLKEIAVLGAASLITDGH